MEDVTNLLEKQKKHLRCPLFPPERVLLPCPLPCSARPGSSGNILLRLRSSLAELGTAPSIFFVVFFYGDLFNYHVLDIIASVRVDVER